MKKGRRSRSASQSSSRTSAQKRMLYRQLFIGALLVLGVAAIITAVWHITRIERFQISQIEVTGGKTISEDEVRERVEAELSGSYYRLIPHRFAPLFPAERIAANIRQIPRVKEVSVEKVSSRTLRVTFAEYAPDALWCSSAAAGTCYFIDETGYSFTAAPVLDGSALVRYYTPGASVAVNERPLGEKVYRATRQFVSTLKKQLDLYTAAVVIHDDTDVTYQLTTGAELKVSNRLTTETSITNLTTIFSNKAYEHLADGDFNYIDLRFGDKVFVSEEKVATSTSSTATSSTETDKPPTSL